MKKITLILFREKVECPRNMDIYTFRKEKKKKKKTVNKSQHIFEVQIYKNILRRLDSSMSINLQ